MKAKWVPDAQNKHGVLNIDLICLNQSQIQSSRVSGFDRRTRPQTRVDTDGGREWNPQTLYLCSPSISGALTDHLFSLPTSSYFINEQISDAHVTEDDALMLL